MRFSIVTINLASAGWRTRISSELPQGFLLYLAIIKDKYWLDDYFTVQFISTEKY